MPSIKFKNIEKHWELNSLSLNDQVVIVSAQTKIKFTSNTTI